MSKKKNKKKNKIKNYNKQKQLKDIQAKKIDSNLEEMKKDISNISQLSENRQEHIEETNKIEVEKDEVKENTVSEVEPKKDENVQLIVKNEQNSKSQVNVTDKILKQIINILKIIIKLIVSCFIITFVYSILIILATLFFVISFAGVGIFSIGIIGTIFDITNLLTKMGAVACIFVGMGSVCLGIFLMVLIIEAIKRFIIRVKKNIKRIFK